MRADADALLARLGSGPPVLLDGPTGTELERRGIDTTGPLWSTRTVRDAPVAVRSVHRDHAAAGAEVLTTTTFRGHRVAFQDHGGDAAWRETVRNAVAVARQVADEAMHPVWVAGSLGPVGDCYRVEEVPEMPVLQDAHRDQARALADAGVDLVLVETMGTVREAQVAVRAVQATGIPVWASFLVLRDAKLLSGEPLVVALEAVQDMAAALLVNCGGLKAVDEAVPFLQQSDRPWGIYANGSMADPVMAWRPEDAVDPGGYTEAASAWLDAGARIVGGCCGTSVDHLQALRQLVGPT